MDRPTKEQIRRAAHIWCGRKERETFLSDVLYFENNWSALPGLRNVVEEVIAQDASAPLVGVDDASAALSAKEGK